MSESGSITVGDRVIYRPIASRRFQEPRELVVYKTGRRWGYAKPEDGSFPDVKFDLQTGYEDAGHYSATHRVTTPEMDAEDQRWRTALEQLSSLGVRMERSGRDFPIEAVEQVVSILASSHQAANPVR